MLAVDRGGGFRLHGKSHVYVVLPLVACFASLDRGVALADQRIRAIPFSRKIGSTNQKSGQFSGLIILPLKKPEPV